MTHSSFFIEFMYNNDVKLAEIKTCCNEQDVWYYDVLMNNNYAFTITPNFDDEGGMQWNVSLKNADTEVGKELINIIGLEIEKHLFLIS